MFPWEEKALKKGLRKGLRDGLKKGKMEGLEEVAVRMFKEGMGIQKIYKLTQLPKEELKKLKEAA